MEIQHCDFISMFDNVRYPLFKQVLTLKLLVTQLITQLNLSLLASYAGAVSCKFVILIFLKSLPDLRRVKRQSHETTQKYLDTVYLPCTPSICLACFSFCFFSLLFSDGLETMLCRSAGSPKDAGFLERTEYTSNRQQASATEMIKTERA